MSDRRPTLQEIVNSALARGLRELYTCLPAKVVKFDASNQRANCQVLVKNVTDGEDESREVTSWPVIPGVPVQFLGAGGFRITCPISDGSQSAATTGTLFWSHRSLDKWLSGTGGEVDPELDHDHALTDAIFIPGLMPFGAAWQSMPTDHMTVGSDTGVQIHCHSDTIYIGDESGSKAIALDSDESNCGWLVFTPNVPPGGAASLVYLPPDTTPTPTALLFPAPLVLLALTGKIAASATQAKAK